MLILTVFVLWNGQIQEDGNECGGHNARAAEYQREHLRCVCKDAVVGTDAVAKTERYRDDAQAARGQRLAGDELNTAHHDGREHHDRCAAQHRLRHDRDERAQLGHQTAENQEDAAGGQRKAVDDLGHVKQN